MIRGFRISRVWLYCTPTQFSRRYSYTLFLQTHGKADISEWWLASQGSNQSLWTPYTEAQMVLCCRRFSIWQPNCLIPNIRLVSDSSNKRITSKLCFISERLQSKTMNNRSQGTKSEPENLGSFYVSAVVGIHGELIKTHWWGTVPILWLLTVKLLS